MVLFVAICLITLGVLAALNALYNIYCIIGIVLFKKKIKNNNQKECPKTQKFNIYLWIIKKFKSIKHADSAKRLNKSAKKWSTIAMILALSITFDATYDAFQYITLGVVCASINTQLTTVTSVLQTLFSKDEDCVCYALCTGDAEDDKKSTYELLFGPTEYKKLISDMESGMTAQEKEDFEDVNDGTDGRAKNNLIKTYLNDDMVNDYKAIVGSNSKFRSGDGKDRSEMSFDELEADLNALLSDYKVNGINPNCNCKSYQKSQLKRKCMGESHYVEGWSWSNIWTSNDNSSSTTTTTTTTSNTPGNATGQYTITLDDGTYYWYHQTSSTSCTQNVKGDDYGYTGSILAGYSANPEGEDKSMSSRGCSIYSTAIALSNLLGQEITPYEVITKVLDANVQFNTDNNKYYFIESTGVTLNGSVVMDMSKLASQINSAYGDQGIVATVASWSQDTLDTYLYDDNSYAYVINSFNNVNGGQTSFTWYGHTKTGSKDNGKGHFIVIRSGSGKGKYKCFTSVRGKWDEGGHGTHSGIVDAMNDELSWSTIEGRKQHDTCLVISRAKSYYTTTTVTTNTINIGNLTNEDVYNALANSGKDYKNKAKTLSIVYETMVQAYTEEMGAEKAKQFAIGLMANIYAEGTPGLVEEAFAQYNYWDFDKDKSVFGRVPYIKNAEQIQYLLNWDYTSKEKEEHENSNHEIIYYQKGSVGVGICQWSFAERIYVLKLYQQMVTNYTDEEFMAADLQMILHQFSPDFKNAEDYDNVYYYKDVVQKFENEGTSAADAASIICLYYEKPNKKEERAVTRAGYATEIAEILSGISASTSTSGDSSSDSSSSSSGESSSSSSSGSHVSVAGENISEYYINNATSKQEKLVNYALNYVGCHYISGGTTLGVTGWKTNSSHISAASISAASKDSGDYHTAHCDLQGADCSGFVLSVYKALGKDFGSRLDSKGFRTVGTEINKNSESNLQYGDIVCYKGHVAIYIGKGKVVSASGYADGIKISNLKLESALIVRRIFTN
jgi:cell wall-associated NlpC family hydrolase